MIVGENEAVLVPSRKAASEGAHNVTVDEPSNVGWLVHIGGGVGVSRRVGFETMSAGSSL